MEITDVRVRLVNNDGKVRAYATIVIDGAFAVHGLRVMEGPNGYWVAMPAEKRGDEYRDVAHPITAEARERIQEHVLSAYLEAREAKAEQAG